MEKGGETKGEHFKKFGLQFGRREGGGGGRFCSCIGAEPIAQAVSSEKKFFCPSFFLPFLVGGNRATKKGELCRKEKEEVSKEGCKKIHGKEETVALALLQADADGKSLLVHFGSTLCAMQNFGGFMGV